MGHGYVPEYTSPDASRRYDVRRSVRTTTATPRRLQCSCRRLPTGSTYPVRALERVATGRWRTMIVVCSTHHTFTRRHVAVQHCRLRRPHKEIVYRTKKRENYDRTVAAVRQHYDSESGRVSATERWSRRKLDRSLSANRMIGPQHGTNHGKHDKPTSIP